MYLFRFMRRRQVMRYNFLEVQYFHVKFENIEFVNKIRRAGREKVDLGTVDV